MRAMRKLTVFLLISLLMLQAALAAAGSACLHERDDHAQHFGHHAHQHRATLPDHSASADTAHAADTATTGDLDQDHDCTTCHANALTGVPARLDWPPLPEGTAIVADDVPLHLSPPPPARPERPNWRTAA